MQEYVPMFMEYFRGFNKAYGLYSIDHGPVDPTKKKVGKAVTIRGDVTADLWLDHLIGKRGIGIIPINHESKVMFAAIDIDVYPLNFLEIIEKIELNQLPLILCRSKSGGAHLFIFFKSWVSAELVRKKMAEFAAILGYGNSEIFPKQGKIMAERGDIGQWINMPYFNAYNTDRHGIDVNGNKLSVEKFLERINQIRIHPEDLETFGPDVRERLPGGPPCLNFLLMGQFPPGTRNNGLFNLGVYARKAFPDNWQAVVEEFNQQYMDPPLTTAEVLGIIKSLNKKNFNYLCTQPPIKAHCQMSRCRQCQYGIGSGGVGFPTFGSLVKVCTVPPIWFLEVDGGGRLELTTEDLQLPRRFQLKCMQELNIMPPLLKIEEWHAIVRRLLEDVTIIEIPEEGTVQGQLRQLIEDFCTSRVTSKTHDELLLGKPWTHNGRHYFRMKDLLAYLDRQKFKGMQLNEISNYLKNTLRATKHFFNIRGKGCNCLSIDEFTIQTESFDPVPLDTPEEHI